MKIYFDNVNFSSSSGPNSFANRLAEEFTKNFEVEVVGSEDSYDIFFCFIEPTMKPRHPAKFVQRLDGIWFKPDQFESHNQLIKWAYRQSDLVVWQSNFDKQMTTKWWGNRFGAVIHNGINLNRAIPSKEILDIKKQREKIWVCSSSWHRQKRLKENIGLFQKFASKNDALFVLGNNPDYKANDDRVIYLGNQSHETCLQIYSIADWMIHLAWLDHCPNVVVEAISQHCPIICTDSGGTNEITRGNGIIIPETERYNFELCDYDNPPALNFDDVKLREVGIENSYLDINKVAKKYLEEFRALEIL